MLEIVIYDGNYILYILYSDLGFTLTFNNDIIG